MSKFIKPEPKLGESLEDYGKRVMQTNCKHEKGYITNTSGPSICVQCGKTWDECSKDNAASK